MICERKNEDFQKFGNREKDIDTLLYHNPTKTLLVGGTDQKVIQYKQNRKTNLWEKLKEYGPLGIECITSSSHLGNLVFFGGNDKIKVINAKTGKLLPKYFDTAVQSIDSLQVCYVSNSKMYISVGGTTRNYYSNLFDLLDITSYWKKNNQKLFEPSTTFRQKMELEFILEKKDAQIQHQKALILSLKEELLQHKKKQESNHNLKNSLPTQIKTKYKNYKIKRNKNLILKKEFNSAFADLDLINISKLHPRSSKKVLIFENILRQG